MPRGGALGRPAFLALTTFLFVAAAAHAQRIVRARAADSNLAADSVRSRDAARRAQRDFERARLANLPRPPDDDLPADCDARIGRFCYWYLPPFGDPPPEPAAIHAARARLLDALGAAAAKLPGDGWIAGQRVRYLVEQGEYGRAESAAQGCAASRWWCGLLAGYAFHAAGNDAAADSVDDVALAAMPEDERCRWTDLSVLLDEGAGRYRRLSCAERGAANARLWWLSRPLLTLPGNDLRAEHFARLTVSRALEHADTPHDLGWGPDMRELIVRYGWPTSWTRAFPAPGHTDDPPVSGQEPSPSFWFFAAPVLAPERGGAAEPVHWELERERPRARYAPPYARAFGEIRRAQIARFRRADGALTVAGYDLTGDTTVGAGPVRVALAVARDAGTPAAVGAPSEASAGAVAVRSPWVPVLVSLEARDTGDRRAARARALASEGDLDTAAGESPGTAAASASRAGARSAFALSDLLLFRPDSAGASRNGAAVLPAPLASASVPEGGLVGVYWEVYGAASTDSLAIEVRARRAKSHGDVPAALGTHGCAGEGASSMRIRWMAEAPPDARTPGRSVVLDLKSLPARWYTLTVAVSVPGWAPVCTARELEITGR
ncbi:MAG TPA: hypothetical protein VFW66_05885 [Gemmatimonadales bacterium]|nr:hypothetical protein [Gemmatimonadales bacterium]